MSERNYPFSEKSTEELMEIIHCSSVKLYKKQIALAKNELSQRKISGNFAKSFSKESSFKFYKAKKETNVKKLLSNANESYTLIEKLLLLLLGPFFVFTTSNNPFESFNSLYKNNYSKKIKQRVILTILSLLVWLILIYFKVF